MLNKIGLLLFVTLSLVMHFSLTFVLADEDRLLQLNKQIEEYQNEISRLKNEANTLSNQVKHFDTQISLTVLEIEKTEEEIMLLGGRIDELETSLQSLAAAFETRAIETYKMARLGTDIDILFTASDLENAVSRFFYLKRAQEADRGLMLKLQSAQNNYKIEKTEQEDLQIRLESQKQELDRQRRAKANLLEITRNDEKKYQQLLVRALAEIQAIQAIIAGKGSEVEAGAVGVGERIATIIPGASVCSSGGHLHFEVVKDQLHQNPANYLSTKSLSNECSLGVPCWDNKPDGPFSFSGSWPWPINDPVRITQGYGMTHYAAALNYYGGAPHTGIDMVNNNGDNAVKAAVAGTLYRGSIGCRGGSLRYVHVKQNDGLDAYYLHVNY
ncbi:hypothetical protein A3D84_04400 [Candidatus Woesebacteria bacterium RIFCSPHIGHO2_02_FULL_42_20]|uniref:Peptidase M23 domain-containing protein n=1 Tax=Candidatus Woesebacteria bacterium RIFCSPHIGHO2_12_FULL_41_24 TaxID=1802510 RepID=A0A1F8AUZ0_9BACT|nr:MAG: hypothetical protein A2W15_02200 [Candidatus Woesebacteria bacterium RBG_16_41_13]OGM30189.1 MAG: hypothetical protein A2873_03595 [Candidatus Woesebacteria bacterium RIFCSPHIGHO2_01_FULL_42_80]OGM34224.1 MAG: hypothetical protein A3D84_04400 [Candidatus Woesebacteria bacterium RIFCSPHIGHO2_02_FULL_42_20]OGM55319.1 MAG: hypothetical protein A3E44_03495 [Candidatus Woesebacteria bacterium RIFCSPHIGHO2_12_FULL_41_24]OGM67987.1 MAG: hypothetical protein A2969_03095 [Candidatus Woesebacteri